MLKKLTTVGGILLFSGSFVLADTPATPAPKKDIALTAPETGFSKQPPACQRVLEECDRGGYHYDMHNVDHKGLWLDCFDPIIKNGRPAPAGVTVNPVDVSACKEAHNNKADAKKPPRAVAVPAKKPAVGTPSAPPPSNK